MFPLIKRHYKIICDMIIIFEHYLLRIQGLFHDINAVQYLIHCILQGYTCYSHYSTFNSLPFTGFHVSVITFECYLQGYMCHSYYSTFNSLPFTGFYMSVITFECYLQGILTVNN